MFKRRGFRDEHLEEMMSEQKKKKKKEFNLVDSQSYFKSSFCKGALFLNYKGEMTKQLSINDHCYCDSIYSHGLEAW